MHNLLALCLLLSVLFSSVLCQQQPECAGRPFPSKLPLPPGYVQLVPLDDYFTGSNLTYSVYPRTSSLLFPEPWQCSLNAQRELGEIVASRFHPA